MVGEAGDYVAPGFRLYEGREIRLNGGLSELTVNAENGKEQSFGFDFDFAAPSGDLFAPGRTYNGAERSPFRSPGHPGIDINGDGRGCNEQAGRFTIRALAVDRQGKLKRLSLLYEQHCEGGLPALFGEIRIGLRRPPGRASAVPTALRWPVRKIHEPGTTVPFTFVARRGLRPGRARIVGRGRRSFHVVSDGCRGKRLGHGRRCQVFVRFRPAHHGRARALLELPGGGRSARARLLGST